jgi:prolyl oligopeptidase
MAKMAARVQAATSSKRPVLLRVDYDAGHGIGSSNSNQYENDPLQPAADLWSFSADGRWAIRRRPSFQPAVW